jgi:hypothetical protein
MRGFWAGIGVSATLMLGCLGLAGGAAALAPEDARHLLVRTGFGATAAEVEELAPLDRAASVDRLLARMQREPLLRRCRKSSASPSSRRGATSCSS